VTEICGILPGGERLDECLRPRDHKGGHVSRKTEVISPKDEGYFVWAFDTELCGPPGECECAAEDVPIECFSFGEIETAKALKLIKDPSLE
jgi:hypothetical protein